MSLENILLQRSWLLRNCTTVNNSFKYPLKTLFNYVITSGSGITPDELFLSLSRMWACQYFNPNRVYLKVQKNLNNSVQGLSSYNAYFKQTHKRHFWPYNRKKWFFFSSTHIIHIIEMFCCMWIIHLFSMISTKLKIGLTQFDWKMPNLKLGY